MSRLTAEGARSVHFTPRALHSLCEYSWSGNVRELANLVERLVILYPDELIDICHLPPKYRSVEVSSFQPNTTPAVQDLSALHGYPRSHEDEQTELERAALSEIFNEAVPATGASQSEGPSTLGALPPEGINLKEMLSDLEIGLIRQALDAQFWVVARAADMLGMRRTTLVEKMRKYGLNKESAAV